MLKTKIILTALLSFSLLSLTACGSPGPKYKNVRSFSEGLAPVQAQTGRWGFINERQEWVIQPRFEDAKEFQGGKAAVRQNSKWGFINKRGEWL
ncbi:MAG: WG repeat-containing protein [Burkholderiales bacterium]|nr:WG repeat-containing protein [Burkholderiales bacterium]